MLPRPRWEILASRSIVGSWLTLEIKELSAKHISTHVPNVSSGLGKLLFSHKPRQTQLQLMEKMLQALDGKTNLLVEMPKGTGCTSASLTAILGWLLEARKQALEKKTRLPRVVCIVRNSQAIPGFLASVSKLPYKLGVSLFGASRDQLCINPALSDSKRGAKDQRCQAQQECGGCSFYSGYRKHVARIKEVYSPNCRDIEDWRKEGVEEGFCPYYANRATADESPLVVATMQQVVSGERSRLAEIAREGVVYIEDGDLLPAELRTSEASCLVLSKTRMQVVEEEIKRCEAATGKAGGLGAISAVAREIASGVELLAEEYKRNLVEWKQGIVELLGADQESEIVNGILPELFGQLAQIQETPLVSTKNQITVRRYLPTVELFVLQLVDLFSFGTETWQVNSSTSEFRIEKIRFQLSRLFGNTTSILVSSEYLPRDTGRFADIVGLQLQKSQANNGTLVLPHSLSPLEQQFGFTLVTSVSRQEPRLFKGLCTELLQLKETQDICPESSRQILDLGTWMGRVLQTVPGGVITIFSSELALRNCHDIWKKTGILAQMDTTKKLCLSLQSCTPADINDPIDGMIPELHGHDQTHLTPAMNTSKSDTGTRGQAVRRFLDYYKKSGAHLMVSRADLPFIEQSLPGDEAARTVILLGDFSADEDSDTPLPTWNPSYLARIVGKVISHVYDHGMVVAVDADVMISQLGTAMPAWTSNLLTSRTRLHIEADGMFEKAKRFFDDVARRKNLLRLDGDPKKGMGHPPLNGWALSHVLAENHKKLNAATPNEQSVLSRKFIPLNPERKQLYEKLKSDAQAQLNNSPPSEEVDPLEKPTTKVKLNDSSVIPTTAALPTSREPIEPPPGTEPENPVNRMISFSALLGPQASQSSQQEDPSLSITYIPNVSSLRTAANTITWNSILMMVASANTNCSSDGVHTLSSTAHTNNPHLSCVICYERDDKEFLVSKCGHVCCKECWEIRLRELLECPVCKDKVRPKTLVRVETK